MRGSWPAWAWVAVVIVVIAVGTWLGTNPTR